MQIRTSSFFRAAALRRVGGVAAAVLAASPLAPAESVEPAAFTVITPLPLMMSGTSSRGASWVDFDNDGLLDIYVTVWAGPNQLFSNLGGGVFENVTSATSGPAGAADLNGDGGVDGTDLGLLLGAWGTANPAADLNDDGVVDGTDLGLLLGAWGPLPPNDITASSPYYSNRGVWADINNNGFMDLFVAQSRGCSLIRNNGDGTFTDITTSASSLGNRLARGAAWADVDGDGFLDLYVSAYHGGDLSSKLLRNNGDGTFSDITVPPLNNTGVGRGVAWADFNNNGLLDLAVANGAPGGEDETRWTNRLYMNNGDGTFTDIAVAAGVADTSHSRSVAWGDYNNNGLLDLYVGNIQHDGTPGYNRLYRNNGDGTFTDVAEEAGLLVNNQTRDGSWIDFDNDGWLDLYVVNFSSRNWLYRNNGDGTFTDVTPSSLMDPANGRSSAWADFDYDGDLDVYITNSEVANNLLVRNDLDNGNSWLQVRLTGVVSNRNAIGARITLTAGGMTQIREVQSGTGYITQHMLTAHFGLGQAQIIDTLSIRWPSGIVQTFTDVGVNQLLDVIEAEVVPPRSALER
jgi:hypothetical protein